MEDVIKAITEIDQLIFETKENNKEQLQVMKQSYQSDIQQEIKKIVKTAEEKAQQIYETQVQLTDQEVLALKERYASINRNLEEAYQRIEPVVLEEVFNKLFNLEEHP